MIERRRLKVEGTVQGVGFRPFVYRLATELGIGGRVNNSAQGVTIEVEAPPVLLDRFAARLQTELPPHAVISNVITRSIPTEGETEFQIVQTESSGSKTAFILPDLALCSDCLHDITEPTNRRYRYPFTNCTHCGPRFSIILSLPYDRGNTTMRDFVMCEQCRAEYHDPLDRRFHAQPNACPNCGPQLALWQPDGHSIAARDEALLMAAQALRDGFIIAVKGIGGFHLMVDARNPAAVRRLRQRKGRYAKPLAVMFPSLEAAHRSCEIDEQERALLTSSAAPIVLLRYKGTEIASEVAPANPYLGVMLPYTPLHHLLLMELGFPVVATSGNLSGEPICIDETTALAKLGSIADLILVHNRPIARPVDDSVVCTVAGGTLTLRRARGYAPQPIQTSHHRIAPVIAVGAQQKNTTAFFQNGFVFLSQHLGDTNSSETFDVFKRTIADFTSLYEDRPTAIVCDQHPDYTTTQFAEQSGLPVLRVQHHYAHVLSCMTENQLAPPVMGVVWDGTGYGTDGTIWGGEFLRIQQSGFTRSAYFRPFPLPGGDAAAYEPRRSLLGVLYAMYGSQLEDCVGFSKAELRLLLAALARGVNCPLTSSVGRLFDAVAALTGLYQTCSFEGEAAMALEYAAQRIKTDQCYPFEISDDTESGCVIDWQPMMMAMFEDRAPAVISAKFHNTLAAITTEIAKRFGISQVILTGGCFQNRVLLEKTVCKLRSEGFSPYWQQRIPPNDGGIALGQIAAALREDGHVLSCTGQVNQHER
jgi:hydrogenase maturation protein HypF